MVNAYVVQSGGCRFESLWGFGSFLKGAHYQVLTIVEKNFFSWTAMHIDFVMCNKATNWSKCWLVGEDEYVHWIYQTTASSKLHTFTPTVKYLKSVFTVSNHNGLKNKKEDEWQWNNIWTLWQQSNYRWTFPLQWTLPRVQTTQFNGYSDKIKSSFKILTFFQ